jgi:ABC-2 type transport system permease protein
MTVALRIFFIGGLTAYRGLINWLSPWIFFPTLVIAPIFQILLFVYIGRYAGVQSDEFYVIGNAVQYASIPCLFAMTHAIAGERSQQTLSYILVTPAGRLPLFLGRALPVIANAMFVTAFSLLVSGLILGIDVPLSSWPAIALVIFGLLLIFTGANLRIDTLPGWMQAISARVPLTHGIEAARRVANGASLGDVSRLLASEAVIGVVYLFLGYQLLLLMERESRKRASLQIA